MKTLRQPLVIIAFLLLLTLLMKAALVTVTSSTSHAVAMERRALRLAGVKPAPEQLAAEIRLLSRAVQWSAGDADSWYLMARNLHRLAIIGDPVGAELMQFLTEDQDTKVGDASQRQLLLDAAIDAYDQAVSTNALISGARFWRVAAEIARDGEDPVRWDKTWKEQVARALAYDPYLPTLWREAGNLALQCGDRETALVWYRASLNEKIEGLSDVVEAILNLPDGDRLLPEAIPDTAPAWRRLAQILFDDWRFADAREAFAKALAMEGRKPVESAANQALSDGDFSQDEALLLHPWRWEPTHGIAAGRMNDKNDGHFLSVVFKLGPENWYHYTQQVPVEQGRHYSLSARVRVQGFTPSEKFGVEIVHPYEASLFAANARCTAGKTNRSDLPASEGRFVQVATEFVVPEGLQMLTVRLRRFGGEDRGTGRIDFTDVSLELLPQPEEQTDDAS